MEINELENLLDLLLDKGVEEFEGFGVMVRFGGSRAPVGEVVETTEATRSTPAPSSMWEERSLWHGHEPLRFPRKEK